MGQGIMPNTVRESWGISFLKLIEDPGLSCATEINTSHLLTNIAVFAATIPATNLHFHGNDDCNRISCLHVVSRLHNHFIHNSRHRSDSPTGRSRAFSLCLLQELGCRELQPISTILWRDYTQTHLSWQ